MDGNWLPAWLNTRHVHRYAPVCRGELLDVGCGSKPYEPILGPRVARYVGFDHPDTQHDRDRVDVWGDAHDLPFEDSSFDTVVSFHVIEHTESPAAVMAEVARVLRPGGAVLIALPFMWGIHEAPRDFARFTSFGLEQLLERAGLEPIEVRPVCGTLGTLALRASYFLMRAGGPLLAPVVSLVQLAGLVMDRLYRDDTDAAGYFAVARKPV